MKPSWKKYIFKAMAGTGIALVFILVILVVLELTLQAIGLFYSPSETAGPGEEGTVSILCVGDSHTFGLAVPPPCSYPNRLAAILNQGRDDKLYNVINMGVPGRNSAVLRTKLKRYVEQTTPSIVLILSGFNNSWNSDCSWVWEGKDQNSVPWWESFLYKLKLYRFVRLNLLMTRKTETVEMIDINSKGNQFFVKEDGEEKLINPGIGCSEGLKSGKELERVTAMDLDECVKICRILGAEPVLLTYALSGDEFEIASDFIPLNLAARSVAKENGVLLIDQAKNFIEHQKKEKNENLYFEHLHLKPIGYELAAKDIVTALAKKGLVEKPLEVKSSSDKRSKFKRGSRQLKVAIEYDKNNKAPVIIASGLNGTTFQVILTEKTPKAPKEDAENPALRIGMELDSLSSLSQEVPSFSGMLLKDPVQINIPLEIRNRYKGKKVHCWLLALEPTALDLSDSLLDTAAPTPITF